MYPADLCIQLVSFTKASFVLLVPRFPFFIQAISPTSPTSKFHSSPPLKEKAERNYEASHMVGMSFFLTEVNSFPCF